MRSRYHPVMTLAGHKIALRPTAAQAVFFAKACGVARFTYNWGLAEWKRQFAAGLKPSAARLNRQLNSIKDQQFPWMKEVCKEASQYAILAVGDAYGRYISGVSHHPKFKKKGVRDSFRAVSGPRRPGEDATQIMGRKIRLPKLGWVRAFQTLRFKGQVKRVTISREGDRWFANVLIDTKDIVPVPAKAKRDVIGVDLGVSTLATLSNGEKVDGPRPLANMLGRLRMLCRAASRKRLGSNNRRKASRRVARLYYRIRCIRADAVHKLTCRLAKGYRAIGIEDLNVRGMAADRSSNAILDMGFGAFRRQLAYKCQWYGSTLVVADRWMPSTKSCSRCGAKNSDIKRKTTFWICPGCGAWHDRDVNAAVNLENAARQAVSACGADSRVAPPVGAVKLPRRSRNADNR